MKYLLASATLLVLIALPTQAQSDNDRSPVPIADEAMVASTMIPNVAPAPVKSIVLLKKAPKALFAYVTGYNTTESQTDGSPCIAAGGNICGRKDTVACPPSIALYTWVSISGIKYQCMDRTAPTYKTRFDISCDKDKLCPDAVTGWKDVVIE